MANWKLFRARSLLLAALSGSESSGFLERMVTARSCLGRLGPFKKFARIRANRLSSLTSSLTGQFGFGYDALSRRTQLTRPNGINTIYSYDSAP